MNRSYHINFAGDFPREVSEYRKWLLFLSHLRHPILHAPLVGRAPDARRAAPKSQILGLKSAIV